MSAPAVLAFDVNETLLDLAHLDGPVERALGDAALRPVWFGLMLQVAFVGTVTGEYVDFSAAQRAALEMLARREGLALDEEAAGAVLQAMRELPAHADVPEGLGRLRDAGVRCIALTNSPLAVLRDQVANAGIAEAFETLVSADEAGELKPGRRPYVLAAGRAGVPIGELMLVAAHHWDVTGALAAGARAAFVERPGMVPSPIGRRPELVVHDLGALATTLEEG